MQKLEVQLAERLDKKIESVVNMNDHLSLRQKSQQEKIDNRLKQVENATRDNAELKGSIDYALQ